MVGANASGYDMVLARIEIDFRSSGWLGEVLVTGARVKRIGNSSLVFELRTWEESSGRTVAEAGAGPGDRRSRHLQAGTGPLVPEAMRQSAPRAPPEREG